MNQLTNSEASADVKGEVVHNLQIHPEEQFAKNEVNKIVGNYRTYKFQSGFFTFPMNSSYKRQIPGFSRNVSFSIVFCPEAPNEYSTIKKRWGIWFNDYVSCGEHGKTVDADSLDEAWQLVLNSAPNNNSVDEKDVSQI